MENELIMNRMEIEMRLIILRNTEGIMISSDQFFSCLRFSFILNKVLSHC